MRFDLYLDWKGFLSGPLLICSLSTFGVSPLFFTYQERRKTNRTEN